MSSQEPRPVTLKHALPDIMDTFQQRVDDEGILLSTSTLMPTSRGNVQRAVPSSRFGTFGLLCNNVGVNFVESAKEVLGDEATPSLMKKIGAAKRGIYVAGMYAEVATLHLLVDNPDLVDDGKEVAAGVTRGYDFIEDTIVGNGLMIGGEVTINYIEGGDGRKRAPTADYGAIARGALTNIGSFRLARFEVEQTPEGAKVVPVRLDAYMPQLKQRYTSPRARLVNCPGHIYRRPGAEHNHNREIFDIMLKNMTEHVYPYYLPQAMEVLNRDWLELPAGEGARS